jgi:hypothetical protein
LNGFDVQRPDSVKLSGLCCFFTLSTVENLDNRKGSEFGSKPLLENEWVLLKNIFMFECIELIKSLAKTEQLF